MSFLKITNFKCFTETDIRINQLTILAGANGHGKSTVIHALLYFRRAIEYCAHRELSGYNFSGVNLTGLNVPLNGLYCLALGDSSTVLNRNSSDSQICIGFFDESHEAMAFFRADNMNPKLFLIFEDSRSSTNASFSIFKHEFYYLNAERVGPRINQVLQFCDYPNAGCQGEFTAQLIGLEGGYFKVEDNRRFGDTQSNYLIDQVNYWLDFIMKGVKIRVDASPKLLTAQILIENYYTVSEPTFATNVGFGISYVLPIIATGLVAKPGTIFIIENPEAHLHPSAQSRIGRFLSMVAASGVQVIIETHSDHLINGIQIAVVEGSITHESITINYFNHSDGDIQPDVHPIGTTAKGELTEWPSGFFDQTQIDFAQLFKLRRSE